MFLLHYQMIRTLAATLYPLLNALSATPPAEAVCSSSLAPVGITQNWIFNTCFSKCSITIPFHSILYLHFQLQTLIVLLWISCNILQPLLYRFLGFSPATVQSLGLTLKNTSVSIGSPNL